MATQPEAKTDAAAEKAYAEASAAKAEVKTDEAAPAAAAPAAKAAPKKKTTTKAAAKKAAPARKPAAKTASKPISKEPAMTKTTDYTAQMTEGLAELQARAKSAYEQGAEYAAEMRELTKGNFDAFVESGRIFSAALQDLTKTAAEESKAAVETLTADAREIAAVKSPTELVQLQGKIASRNFDAAVAQLSKATEAWVKLANDVAAPLSSRVSLAMDKARKAA
ncbi:phasin family protein [Pelagerythrobacter rhizovicinus]|uniref:Phasin family protein n=1 Tax=Pelagerythrobacter rhizovicinus TaxID=2268576 RepID=A0A4Q2KGZ3_9SPHN|nr:phasin family protein [Pelagerythrobacter rhizovicinus]RXZ64365.1 phasin family protein [Pelagerythrobacter rhizovicinus]